MVTMRDVAKAAGVSEAAVSFAINQTGSLSEETRKKILQVVKELNYKPNIAAQRLSTKKTNTIGLIIPKPGPLMVFVGLDILSGIGAVASDQSYNILLAWEDEKGGSKVLDLVQNGSVSGLTFFLPINDQVTFRTLNDMNFPYVLMSRPPERMPCNWVDVDNMDVAYKATLMLIKDGHRRIGFIGPAHADFLVSADRLAGYRQALLTYDLPYNEAFVHLGIGNKESGKEAMDKFLALPEPPSAVIAGGAMPAVGLMEKMKDAGMEYPKDMAIIALMNTGDSHVVENFDITAFEIPTHEIARQSASLLIKRILLTRRTEPENIVIQPNIVIRKTFLPS